MRSFVCSSVMVFCVLCFHLLSVLRSFVCYAFVHLLCICLLYIHSYVGSVVRLPVKFCLLDVCLSVRSTINVCLSVHSSVRLSALPSGSPSGSPTVCPPVTCARARTYTHMHTHTDHSTPSPIQAPIPHHTSAWSTNHAR